MMSLFKELKRRNVIRVATAYLIVGWLLVQVLGIATDSFEAPAWVMKLAITLIVIGFFISLIISWVYELTPDGIKKEKDINSDDSITQETSNKLNYITIVAAFAVAGMFAWQQFGYKDVVESKDSVIPAKAGIQLSKDTIQPNSIAVLPFTDLSKAGDQEYFSDGMAEEILNVLVRVDVLKVASRTSSFQFKGQEIGIPEIAKQLKVRHVLEGSVRKSGDTVRITAQLIDAENDKHLWSQTFDRPLTTNNIFAIQDEISNAIVTALSKKLGLTAVKTIKVNKTTENLSAYELYLKARPLFLARIDLDKADDYLVAALKLDDQFAKAWELRAVLQYLKPFYGYSKLSLKASAVYTVQYAQKALSIEPNSALALSTLAINYRDLAIENLENASFSEILNDFNHAIKIDPYNATSYNWRGRTYMMLGNISAGLLDFEKCLSLEPNDSACTANEIIANIALGRDNKVFSLLEKSSNKGMDMPFIVSMDFLATHKQSLLFKSILNSQAFLLGWNRQTELYQAFLQPNQDHHALIDDILKFIEQKHVGPVKPLLLVPIGGYDLKPLLPSVWSHSFYGYRQSAQFKTYLKKIGIYQYWQQKGYPPQCRALGENDFECD
jgi:TolB-like protein